MKALTEDVTFVASCDGTEQRYVCVFPEGSDGGESRDVLVALHGHGSDRWQFIKQGRSECRAARDVAVERGMVLVSPDYRAATSWMGPKAESDLVDIILNLRKEYSVKRVFLCGASMGGASALTFAALHPELLAGVVAMNGMANHLEYGNFQAAIGRSFGGTKTQIPEEYHRRSAEFHASRFAMPVGLTTGGKDTSTPPDSVLRFAESLRETNPRVLLIHRQDGGHATTYEDARKVLEFVMKEGH